MRVLLGLASGRMAHFELGAGKASIAVTHRSVEEIWFVISGRGEMWRKQGEREETIALEPGEEEAISVVGPWPPAGARVG